MGRKETRPDDLEGWTLAPWTPDQVQAMQYGQNYEDSAIYCPEEHSDEVPDKETILVFTTNHMICPVCGYTCDFVETEYLERITAYDLHVQQMRQARDETRRLAY